MNRNSFNIYKKINTNLLLILLLLVGCAPTESENNDTTDPTYSPLGVWFGDDEFTKVCDYVDAECINCEYSFGETEPSDLNIVEQDIILTISPISLTVEWCYSYDDYDEEWCNEKDDYADFNCTWDELNNFSTTCNSFETAVLYLDENQLCVDEEYMCYDFSISNSGNDIELTGMSDSHCYTIVAHKP